MERRGLWGGLYSQLGEDYHGPIPRIAIHGAPPWYVSLLDSMGSPPPIERPPLGPAKVSDLPLLRIRLIYIGKEKDGQFNFATRIGLASETEAPVALRRYQAKLEAGVLRLPFGSFDLVVSEDGEGVRAKREPSARQAVKPDARADSPKTAQTAPLRVKPTPFVIRGAKLDPNAFKVSAEPVEREGVLLTGPAAHWRTAHANVDVGVIGLHVRTAKDGVFHAVELVDEKLGARVISHAWCGPVFGLGIKTIRCIAVTADGSEGKQLYFTGGAEWMSSMGGAADGSVSAQTAEINPSDEDLTGPMTFSLRLDNADRRLKLHAEVERQGDTVVIWRGELEFDAQDTARLPLWTHTLVVHKVKPGVVDAKLQAGGDGAGPLEIPALPR